MKLGGVAGKSLRVLGLRSSVTRFRPLNVSNLRKGGMCSEGYLIPKSMQDNGLLGYSPP